MDLLTGRSQPVTTCLRKAHSERHCLQRAPPGRSLPHCGPPVADREISDDAWMLGVQLLELIEERSRMVRKPEHRQRSHDASQAEKVVVAGSEPLAETLIEVRGPLVDRPRVVIGC